MEDIKSVENLEITFIDAGISKGMFAYFMVTGVIDGVIMEERVTLSDNDIMKYLGKTKKYSKLSTYEFLLAVKQIKDTPTSKFSKNILTPLALQQHRKKNMEMNKLKLMAELIKPKLTKIRKFMTYNRKGEIIVHKTSVE